MSVRIANVRSIRESTAGLLLLLPDGRELWCPKSVLHDDSDVYRARTIEDRQPGTLVVADWWAEKNGLDRKIDASDGDEPDEGLTGEMRFRR